MRYKTANIFVISLFVFSGILISHVRAVDESPELVADKTGNFLKEAAENCLPLALEIEPSSGLPSTVFRASCYCSKTKAPGFCPQLSYESGFGADIQLEQNTTSTSERCIARAHLKVNLTSSYLESVTLKCRIRGFRSTKKLIKVQKMGNRRECSDDNDCRYPQQQCLREYERSDSKVCKCPLINDLFDPSRPDVCIQFIVTESGGEQPALISILMIVIIAVLVAGIVLLGFRMMPTTRCCPGFVTGDNFGIISDNTVPFRQMAPATQADAFNQENVDSPPPPYNTVAYPNPPPYSESQKDAAVHGQSNVGADVTNK